MLKKAVATKVLTKDEEAKCMTTLNQRRVVNQANNSVGVAAHALSETNNSAMKNLGSMVVHLPKPNVIEHFFGFF